jgi:hypothetical protein
LCAWWRDHQQLTKRIDRNAAIIEMLREGLEVERMGIIAAPKPESPHYDSVEQFLAALKCATNKEWWSVIDGVCDNEIGQDSVPALLSMLDDPSAELRKRAGCAIGKIKTFDESAIPQIVQRLNDPDDSIRYRMMLALQKCGPEAKAAIPLLRKSLENPEDPYRTSAAQTLWSINRDPRAIDVLIEVLQDDKSLNRTDAAVILGEIGPKDAGHAVPVLLAACRAENKELGVFALNTLMNFLPPKEMLDLLLEANKDADPSFHREVRILFIKLDQQHPDQPLQVE